MAGPVRDPVAAVGNGADRRRDFRTGKRRPGLSDPAAGTQPVQRGPRGRDRRLSGRAVVARDLSPDHHRRWRGRLADAERRRDPVGPVRPAARPDRDRRTVRARHPAAAPARGRGSGPHRRGARVRVCPARTAGGDQHRPDPGRPGGAGRTRDRPGRRDLADRGDEPRGRRRPGPPGHSAAGRPARQLRPGHGLFEHLADPAREPDPGRGRRWPAGQPDRPLRQAVRGGRHQRRGPDQGFRRRYQAGDRRVAARDGPGVGGGRAGCGGQSRHQFPPATGRRRGPAAAAPGPDLLWRSGAASGRGLARR